MSLFSPNHLFQGSISKYGHILRYGGKGWNVRILEGAQIHPIPAPA